MKVLLIGNGPSACRGGMRGSAIDSFDGAVVRFNLFAIEGFEEYIGTRLDYWFTSSYEKVTRSRYHFDYLRQQNGMWMVNGDPRNEQKDTVACLGLQHKAEKYNVPFSKIPASYTKNLMEKLSIWPTTGLVAIMYFSRLMDEVHIIGFDGTAKNSTARHHYYNEASCIYGSHSTAVESRVVASLVKEGKVYDFGS